MIVSLRTVRPKGNLTSLDIRTERESETAPRKRWRFHHMGTQCHGGMRSNISSRRDREGVASNAATERAASANSRGAACGQWQCTYYEGGECCQSEHIGGLRSEYFDGVGTSLSSEEGAGSVDGKKLILSVTMNSRMDYLW